MKVVPLIALAWSCAAADLRQDVLRAIFPGMDVVATTRHRDDSSVSGALPYPDAFAAEPIFQVNGAPRNEVERCASDDLLRGHTTSTSREVRLQVFNWPRTRADVLAVLQYRFIGARPSNPCPTIGLLAHLSRRGQTWVLVEGRLVEPDHHWSLASASLADVTGDGVEEFLLESNLTGGGASGTFLQIFDLSGRRLREILATDSRVDTVGDRYAQTLDPIRSAESGGKSVCFELTVYVKNAKIYTKPRVTHECYPTGTGVDEKQAQMLNEQLRPLNSTPR